MKNLWSRENTSILFIRCHSKGESKTKTGAQVGSVDMKKKLLKQRKRILQIIEVGSDLDPVSRFYDYINAGAIILNLVMS